MTKLNKMLVKKYKAVDQISGIAGMVTPDDISFLVRREDVQLALIELYPENVNKRRRHRLQRIKYCNPDSNYVWYIVQHGKLKPYGLRIQGVIDGYSRWIIWLEVASTNKVPELIAKYYLDALNKFWENLNLSKPTVELSIR